jgi:serine/threonine-protein kinase
MEPVLATPGSDLEERLRGALAPRYVLLRPVGKGGMGAVYLAREPELSRLVAVKVLASELAKDETSRARFIREAQAAASIAHPNVIAIHSIGALDDGTPYFVMQYATGESIAARLEREGPVTSAEATRMIGELASALAAAHTRGIVHRDVKPANVLYDQETGRVLITDFGIAAVRAMPGTATIPQLTGTGVMLGTPRYMSPEQLTAEPANDRTDVYGLGLVAYELLTGSGPFEVTSPMQLMAAHLRDTPRRLSERRPDVDPHLEELVLACLAKDPAARPSAADIVRRLGAAEVILEWPPPGLAPLQGAVSAVARLFIVGGALAATAFLILFGSGSGLAAQRLSLLMVLLVVVTAIGAALLGVALRRLWRVVRFAGRAVGVGYGWMTIAETLVDARRDTGLLIAGLREYSTLSADERDAMRRRRVTAGFVALVAGIAPVPLLVLFLWIVPRGSLPSWVAALVAFGPIIALAAWTLELRRHESRRLRSARARIVKRRTPDDVTTVLVATWQRTFDTARSGQRLGAGTSGRAALARAAVVLLTIGVIGTLICLVPVFFVGVAGSSLWSRMGNGANVAMRTSVAETARPLVLPQDSSISAADAGRAFFLLQLPPGKRATPEGGFVTPPTIGIASVLPPTYPATLFARPMRGADGKPIDVRKGPVTGGPGPDGILAYAKGGLSPAERTWLEQLDASPRWALWRQFARAPRADILGARLVLPFADTLLARNLPIAKLGNIKVMAYESVARAALYRSRGETARADTVLRETISAGFRLADDGTTLLEMLYGDVIVGIAHNALHEASVLDGRPDGKEWQARMSVVSATTSQMNDSLAPATSAELDAQALRRRLIAAVVSPHLMPGARTSSYFALAMSPCTNVRELVAGPSPDARDALLRARTTLARFPSESAFLDLLDRQPAVVVRDSGAVRMTWSIMPIAKLSGWILRNPRIPGCVSKLMSDYW